MSDETIKTETVKTASDGMVKVTLEKYNELVETVASQKSQITQLRSQPPVINRTVVNKTAEMLSQEHRAWGITFMLGGAAALAVGAIRFKAGSSVK